MATPPFNPNETLPGNTDVVSQYPGVERTFRDIVESWILFEHGRSGHHAIPVIATSTRDSITDWEVGSIIYNTSLSQFQVTQTIDPDIWRTVGPEFPAGTRIPFQQTTPPTGWTKEAGAAYNDAVMALTTGAVGTSGATALSSVLGARTITQANIPSYGLTVNDPGHQHGIQVDFNVTSVTSVNSYVVDVHSGGAGNKQTKSATTGISVSSGGSGVAMDFDAKKVTFVIGIKS